MGELLMGLPHRENEIELTREIWKVPRDTATPIRVPVAMFHSHCGGNLAPSGVVSMEPFQRWRTLIACSDEVTGIMRLKTHESALPNRAARVGRAWNVLGGLVGNILTDSPRWPHTDGGMLSIERSLS